MAGLDIRKRGILRSYATQTTRDKLRPSRNLRWVINPLYLSEEAFRVLGVRLAFSFHLNFQRSNEYLVKAEFDGSFWYHLDDVQTVSLKTH